MKGLIFSGNSHLAKELYLLCDSDMGHYNVFTNIKVAMAKGTYVTRVTRCTTIHIDVKKLAPSVLSHHLVPKISLGIVLHATGSFSVKSVFRII